MIAMRIIQGDRFLSGTTLGRQTRSEGYPQTSTVVLARAKKGWLLSHAPATRSEGAMKGEYFQ